MATTSPRQRKTAGRVMHEFKHGELKSGPGGKAGKVRSRRQAVAIALSESGASKYRTKGENRRRLAKSTRKEARGDTARQRAEGDAGVGARRRSAARTATKQELYAKARKRGIPGRSRMSKQQLERALR